MKLFFLLFVLLSFQVQAQNSDVECETLVDVFSQSMNAEIQTINNLVRYLDHNGTNWDRSHQALRLISTSKKARKNFRYTGAARVEANKSRQNKRSMINHRNKLNNFKNDFMEKLTICLGLTD
jgi:Mg2+ and Co2+ transporter CorA